MRPTTNLRSPGAAAHRPNAIPPRGYLTEALIAGDRRRASEEAKSRLKAFLEKRGKRRSPQGPCDR